MHPFRWIGAYVRRNYVAEAVTALDIAISLIERDKVVRWTSADDDDLRTLKRARHILEMKSK